MALWIKSANSNQFRAAFDLLFHTFGRQHWWPADSPWEVAVGAVLTQNTSWVNVEYAINNLKQLKLLSPKAVADVSDQLLSEAIRPSGFFNLKTQRLRALTDWWLQNVSAAGSLKNCDITTAELRLNLLAIKGIGPETADSIILYAFGRPVFVIDAYTRRIAYRHLNIPSTFDYEALQKIFMDNLPEDAQLFNEYHALLVQNAKRYCGKRSCQPECPLRKLSEEID